MTGVGGIGLLIGGLSLSNTVAAATFERIRDFGIKQALGATDLQLLGEVLRESLVVSLAGGMLGPSSRGWGVRPSTRAPPRRASSSSSSRAAWWPSPSGSRCARGDRRAYATFRILRVPPAEAIRRGA